MKAIVIGLGSMGKRRIRLMKEIASDLEIIGIDSRADRREEAEEKFGIKTAAVLDDSVLSFGADRAFVCTSPLSHAAIISECLDYGLHVFTEINLVRDGYEENIRLAQEKGLVLFLSSTNLYSEERKYIARCIRDSGKPVTYNYHIGQYLPDWHPWENYTDYFIGNAKTNGCREILTIEMPWIYKTFGDVIEFHVLKGKKTSLKTSFDDCYNILLRHESGAQGTFSVDVLSRKAVRNFEAYSEDLYLSWDGTPEGLNHYDIEHKCDNYVHLYDDVEHDDNYASFITENAYKFEIEAFFRQIADGVKSEYTFTDDIEVLDLIDRIEGIS